VDKPIAGAAIRQNRHLVGKPLGGTMIYPNKSTHDTLALAPPISGRILPQNHMLINLPNEV